MFSGPGSILPIQSSAIWFIHGSLGIHNASQGSQTDCSKQGYKCLDNWLVRVISHQTCLQLPVRPQEGKVRPTLQCWQTLN